MAASSVSKQRQRRALSCAQDYFRNRIREHEPAKKVCDKRGLVETVRARYGIGYAPRDWRALLAAIGDADAALEVGLASRSNSGHVYARFRDRLMFPIYDEGGQLCGFSGRSMGDGKPKYLNTPASDVFKKSELVYGLHEIGDVVPGQRVAVCEGYTDAIIPTTNGQPAVATMGVNISTEQLALLSKKSDGIVFCMDDDEAGRRAFDRVVPRLLEASTPDFFVGVASLSYGMDPDDMIAMEGGDAFRYLISTAPNVGQIFVENMLANKDDESWQQFEKAEALAPYIAAVPDGMVQSLMIDHAAMLLGRSPHLLFDFKESGISYYGDCDTGMHAPPTGSELAPEDARSLALRAVLSWPDVSQFAVLRYGDRLTGDPVCRAIVDVADQVAAGNSPSSSELLAQWQSSAATAGFAERAMDGGILSPALAKGAIVGATRVLSEQRAMAFQTDQFAPSSHI